jgi:hypothetical protein
MLKLDIKSHPKLLSVEPGVPRPAARHIITRFELCSVGRVLATDPQLADSRAQENACASGVLAMQQCRRLRANTAHCVARIGTNAIARLASADDPDRGKAQAGAGDGGVLDRRQRDRPPLGCRNTKGIVGHAVGNACLWAIVQAGLLLASRSSRPRSGIGRVGRSAVELRRRLS